MAKTLVSVDEYLQTSYEPDWDYVDGVLEERNLGESDHSYLQTLIANWILVHYEDRLAAVVELRVQISETRFRIPDVTIIDGLGPARGVLKQVPPAVIEIRSAEDRPGRIWTRMQDYLDLGVRYCWLVDPKERSACRYLKTGIEDVVDGILRAENPAFEIPLPQLFARFDKITR